jgi:hypothetical protein
MKSFTSMIRAKVWPANANKASGEQIIELRREMEVLDCHQLRCIVGGDEDAPKGSWISSSTASS